MKKAVIFFYTLSCILLFASFSISPTGEKRTVVIDFGHGGEDHGAKIQNLSEKAILLDLQEQIRKESRTIATQIIFLKEVDKFMTLEDRVKKINEIKPNLVISLHVNSSDDKETNGITGYVSPENSYYDESHKNAIRLCYYLSQNVLNNRGVKDANLYILKNANCPALTLELGYITNDRDKNYLSSKAGQFEIAYTICQMVR